jgi:hypothetical protein
MKRNWVPTPTNPARLSRHPSSPGPAGRCRDQRSPVSPFFVHSIFPNIESREPLGIAPPGSGAPQIRCVWGFFSTRFACTPDFPCILLCRTGCHAYLVYGFVLRSLLFFWQQQLRLLHRHTYPGNSFGLPGREFFRRKSARALAVFRFPKIITHILTIRQIDHPFIPLSFHWNAALKRLNSCTCTTPWLFKNPSWFPFYPGFCTGSYGASIGLRHTRLHHFQIGQISGCKTVGGICRIFLNAAHVYPCPSCAPALLPKHPQFQEKFLYRA